MLILKECIKIIQHVSYKAKNLVVKHNNMYCPCNCNVEQLASKPGWSWTNLFWSINHSHSLYLLVKHLVSRAFPCLASPYVQRELMDQAMNLFFLPQLSAILPCASPGCIVTTLYSLSQKSRLWWNILYNLIRHL